MTEIETTVALSLLERMIRIRAVEESIARRYPEARMRCPTHLCTGQEAVPAAAGMALRRDDFAVSTHRAHGHYLGKGGDLVAMLAEIHGKAGGCCGGRGGSMHLMDRAVGFTGSAAIVASTVPVGVGLGLSIRLKNTDQVSCVFLGDATVEEGVFYESVNFAAVKELPVLFICENNLYSVYSPLSVRQPEGRKIFEMVEAMGVKSGSGDGNDAQDVYARLAAALKEIRQGGGPRFFEFATYRWREHCGPNFDNDAGYRRVEEYEEWKRRDPIRILSDRLSENGALSAEDMLRLNAKAQDEVDAAFSLVEQLPFPGAEDSFYGLFKGTGDRG